MSSLRRIILATCLTVGWGSGLYSQASPCLTDSQVVTALRKEIAGIYSGTDSMTSVTANYPWAQFANIQIVSDSSTCASGVAAFNQKTGLGGTPAAISAAYVFALGGTGFAVVCFTYLDPAGAAPVFIFGPGWQPVVVVHV